MFVCEKCHNRDGKVTKCMIPFSHHPNHINSKCDVCGITTTLVECWAYNSKPGVGIRRTQCSSVKNAMSATK